MCVQIIHTALPRAAPSLTYTTLPRAAPSLPRQQLAKGDLAAAAATALRPLGALSSAHADAPPTATHTTAATACASGGAGAGAGVGGWNASGVQACLACSRPLQDAPPRRAPSGAACLAQVREREGSRGE